MCSFYGLLKQFPHPCLAEHSSPSTFFPLFFPQKYLKSICIFEFLFRCVCVVCMHACVCAFVRLSDIFQLKSSPPLPVCSFFSFAGPNDSLQKLPVIGLKVLTPFPQKEFYARKGQNFTLIQTKST